MPPEERRPYDPRPDEFYDLLRAIKWRLTLVVILLALLLLRSFGAFDVIPPR